MKDFNSEEINREIRHVCDRYQQERVNGQWYVEQTGLNKIARLLGGDYKTLTKKQNKIFRQDCVNCAHIGTDVKSW